MGIQAMSKNDDNAVILLSREEYDGMCELVRAAVKMLEAFRKSQRRKEKARLNENPLNCGRR